jgi:hypothetical protein
LHNDPNTLSHLFNTDTVTIIAISSGTYWYVRIRLVINIVRCCSSRIPAYPWLGWVGPPLHFHLGPGQVSGGTLSGSSPPPKKKNKLYVRVSLHTARIILRCPERHPNLVGLVHARANEHWPQQQGTMTNRVRHLATSARKRNVVLVEAFFPLLVKGARDVRGVRAFRTTTGLVVLGRIPLLNIRDRGKVAGPILSKGL